MAFLWNAMPYTKIFCAVLIAILFVMSSADEVRIHEHMSPEELLSVFHVEHAAHVPEYHVVELSHSISRRHIQSQHPDNAVHGSAGKVSHEKSSPKSFGNKAKSKPVSLHNDEMSHGASISEKKPELADDVEVLFVGDDDVNNRTIGDDIDSGFVSDSDLNVVDRDSDNEFDYEDDEGEVHKINFNAFGKQMKLVLKKQDSLLKKDGLKMWSAVTNETHPHGVEYLEMESGNEEIGDLYHDEQNGAALLIRRDPTHGKLLVDGSIGHDLVIKPLPMSLSRIAPPEQDDEAFLDASAMDDMVSIDTGFPIGRRRGPDGPIVSRERSRRGLDAAQHVVIRRNPVENEQFGDYAFMEPDHMSKRHRRKRSSDGRSRRTRDAPYVIYPEILVIVDYDGYRLHGGDNVQIKRYFVSFWNGVDLRYKLLKGPRIRISIAGIIISRGRDATPYLERNRVGRDAIDSAAALTDMGKYLFRERRLPVYDIAVAVTKLDMCRRQYANDVCNRGTAGFAYVGGACVVNKRLEKVNSVAIIEDTGGFSGIIVAAHEVGHLLGAVHDGSPPPSYLGGPGAEKCRWEDGFIMSDLRHTEKGFRWSSCSVQSFHHFLNGDTATCLFNSPHEDESLPRVLPGRLLTLDAQCRKDRGTSACFKDERVCAQLFCFDSASGYCVAYRPAAEGSPCGDGQYCINGRCVAEHENIIPDYSQHTPSYVRIETSPFYGTNATVQRFEEGATQPYQYTNDLDSILYGSGTNSPASFTVSPPFYGSTVPTTFKQTYGQSTAFETYPTKHGFDFFLNMAETKASPTVVVSTTPKLSTKSIVATTPNSIKPTSHTYNKYSITSSKSPYDFSNFYNPKTKSDVHKHSEKQTTVKPLSLDEYDDNAIDDNVTETSIANHRKPRPFDHNQYDFNTYYNWTTTRSPYDFNIYSNNYRNIKSNNIKRSYNASTYYNTTSREQTHGSNNATSTHTRKHSKRVTRKRAGGTTRVPRAHSHRSKRKQTAHDAGAINE